MTLRCADFGVRRLARGCSGGGSGVCGARDPDPHAVGVLGLLGGDWGGPIDYWLATSRNPGQRGSYGFMVSVRYLWIGTADILPPETATVRAQITRGVAAPQTQEDRCSRSCGTRYIQPLGSA